MDCIFCKIVSGEIESEKIYEDDTTLAFLDINPIAPGHTMIIPKEHKENIINSDFDIVKETFETVKIVTEMINETLKPQGFNIGINHGKQAGQAIDHLHVHIIPRFENDGGGSMHTIVRNPPKEQTVEEIAGSIREAKPINKPKILPIPEEQEPQPEPEEDINKNDDENHKHRWDEIRTP